jgi:hypothetical protein
MVGSAIVCKHYTRHERPERNKHSSLHSLFESYEGKCLITLTLGGNLIKLFSSLLTLRPNKLLRDWACSIKLFTPVIYGFS